MSTHTLLETKPRTIFYGWWIALVSAVCLFLGPIPIAVFSFAVLVRPLVQEFHSGRGAVSFARTLFALSTIGLPFAGRLMDRYGPRNVILPCSGAAGLIMLSAWFCSRSIWQLYVFFLALGVATCGITPVSYCTVITHWFDKYRGLALALMMFGLGLGALIMPVAAQYLTANFGWRSSFELAGTATLVITVPAIALFLKDRPEAVGLLQDGSAQVAGATIEPPSGSGVSWRDIWRDRTFWALLCAFVVVAAAVQGCLSHIAAIVADRGNSAPAAAVATSLFGGGVLAGRTGSGYFLDRFFAPRVAAAIFGAAAVGIGLLRLAASQDVACSAAFLIGFGLGAEGDLMAYLTSRYFGLRSFGAINGIAFAGFALSGGLGTYLMGVAFDNTGSYALILVLFCILALIGTTLMLSVGPYRYPVRARVPTKAAAALLVETRRT